MSENLRAQILGDIERVIGSQAEIARQTEGTEGERIAKLLDEDFLKNIARQVEQGNTLIITEGARSPQILSDDVAELLVEIAREADFMLDLNQVKAVFRGIVRD